MPFPLNRKDANLMATSADVADKALLDSFKAAAQSIVDLTIDRQEMIDEINKGSYAGAKKLAGRLLAGIRQLVDTAERESRPPLGIPMLKEKLTGAAKKAAVKAGTAILISAVCKFLPLGWFSILGFLIRPALQIALTAASGFAIDLIVDWYKNRV